MNLKNLRQQFQRNLHNFKQKSKQEKLAISIYIVLSLLWNTISLIIILFVANLNHTFVECVFILTSFWLSKHTFGKPFHLSSMAQCFVISNVTYYVLNKITTPLGISLLVPIMLGVGLSYITSKFVKKLCNCCADITSAISNGFYSSEIAANNRAINQMQDTFALSRQFADCCCENRLGIADLKSTVLSENCADRAALADGLKDVLINQTANTQRILDQLCNDKIDAKNEKIADLQREILMKDLQASQIAQTAQLRAGQEAEVDALYNRLSNCPVPTTPVYGRTPIFTCPNAFGSSCGCGLNTTSQFI